MTMCQVVVGHGVAASVLRGFLESFPGGLVILHWAASSSRMGCQVQAARASEVENFLRDHGTVWAGEVGQRGYGALLWRRHLVTASTKPYRATESKTHMGVFYEIKLTPRSGQNQQAPTVVGATVFRKRAALEAGGRPWSRGFREDLVRDVAAAKPLFVSAIFEDSPGDVSKFCRSCGGNAIGMFCTWFKERIGTLQPTVQPAALPNGIFFLGRATFSKPIPELAPEAPSWLGEVFDDPFGRWLPGEAPHWQHCAAGVPEQALDEIARRPYIGKVRGKQVDLQWWPEGLHQTLVWIDGKGRWGGAGSRRNVKRQRPASPAQDSGDPAGEPGSASATRCLHRKRSPCPDRRRTARGSAAEGATSAASAGPATVVAPWSRPSAPPATPHGARPAPWHFWDCPWCGAVCLYEAAYCAACGTWSPRSRAWKGAKRA